MSGHVYWSPRRLLAISLAAGSITHAPVLPAGICAAAVNRFLLQFCVRGKLKESGTRRKKLNLTAVFSVLKNQCCHPV
ncbi:hypothetical protein AGIG_G19692 [Arapaima gigas]